ncbi:hypothetical protein [Mycoplasmoides fastidiosum]|uniref:hypothetical protein n=1 Tax=Mycoplasmoides fastidiosum TaxID=92758 RepID=UPI002114F157|nr:hypothetical protein [Mycoplasmoides fastidiosum]UUD38123.1 hypothetical protein NPA10_01930 [Mycoplasmoides fastidiosum]
MNNTELQNNFSESFSSDQQEITSNNSQAPNNQTKNNLPKLSKNPSTSTNQSNQESNSQSNNSFSKKEFQNLSEDVINYKLATPLKITGYKKYVSNVDEFVNSLQDAEKQSTIFRKYFETNYDSDPNLTFQIVGTVTKLSNQISSDNIQNIIKLHFKYKRKYKYQKLLNNQLVTDIRYSSTNNNLEISVEILPEAYWIFKHLSIKKNSNSTDKNLYEKQLPSFWKNLLEKEGELNNSELSVLNDSMYSSIDISTDIKSSIGFFSGFASYWLESSYKTENNYDNSNFIWKLNSVTDANDLNGSLKFSVQLLQKPNNVDNYISTKLISDFFVLPESSLAKINVNKIKNQPEKGLHISVNNSHSEWNTKIQNWKEKINQAYTNNTKVSIDQGSLAIFNQAAFEKSKVPKYFNINFEKITYLTNNKNSLSDISEYIWPVQISFIDSPKITEIYFQGLNNQAVQMYIVYSLHYKINELEENFGGDNLITSIKISGTTKDSFKISN